MCRLVEGRGIQKRPEVEKHERSQGEAIDETQNTCWREGEGFYSGYRLEPLDD